MQKWLLPNKNQTKYFYFSKSKISKCSSSKMFMTKKSHSNTFPKITNYETYKISGNLIYTATKVV